MRVARVWLLRLRAMIFRRHLDADAAEELRLHLDGEVRHHIARGLPIEAARRAAALELGSPTALVEACRDSRGLAWLDALRLDLRHTLRRWRRRPAFVATLVLTLASGIAATTALFSLVDAVLLRPLPWPSADRLVAIHAVVPERLHSPSLAATWNRAPISWTNWQRLAAAPAFEQIGVFYFERSERFEAPARMTTMLFASSSLLPMLGVHPILGRHFTAAEDSGDTTERPAPARIEDIRPHTPRMAIVSYEVWQADFNGRDDVIGRLVRIGAGTPYTIVGVLPPGFRFQSEQPDFLLPIGERQYISQYQDILHAIARLAPGVSAATASKLAEPIVRGDASPQERTARLVPLLEDQVGASATALWLLFGGAALLLAIACSTVAGLLLGDASGRRHEMAVRASLGGGGLRIVRQLIVEHVLLAVVAACAGLVLTVWLTPLLVAFAPGALPRLETVTVDARIGLFALGLGSATVLVFGLAPAFSVAWTQPREVLAGSAHEGSPRGHRGLRAVVTVQLALALVLLVGASLFGETMFRLTSRPLGFEPAGLAILSFTWSRNPSVEGNAQQVPADAASLSLAERAALGRANSMRQTFERNTGGIDGILRSLAATPGVLAAAGSTHVPFVGASALSPVRADGQAESANRPVRRQLVTPGYFRAMRIPMLRGRPFVGAETHGVVVSLTLERQLFGGDALGRRLIVEGASRGTYEVIGVVADVKHDGFAAGEEPSIYLSNALGATMTHIVVRSSADPGALLPGLVEAVREADPRVIVTAARAMDALVSDSVAAERLRAMLSSVFGGAALLLAALGLYGLAARLVIDRRREIVIRMALGARPVHVRTLVLRDGLVIVGAGLAVGLPAAFGASQLMRAFLFGVSPTAPHVFLTGAGVLAAVALVSMIIPARGAWAPTGGRILN